MVLNIHYKSSLFLRLTIYGIVLNKSLIARVDLDLKEVLPADNKFKRLLMSYLQQL